jgi:hypothetical protein
MRMIFTAVLAAALGCSNLLADSASKQAKIDQFLKLIKAEAIQDQIYSQIGMQIDRATLALAQQNGLPAAEQQSAVADLKTKMTAAMKALLSWDKLKPGMVKIYDDTYTEEELDAMLVFFKSPAGQSYITKSQTVAAKSRDLAEGQVKELSSEFQTMGKEWMDQHPKTPAAAPAPAAPKPPAPK